MRGPLRANGMGRYMGGAQHGRRRLDRGRAIAAGNDQLGGIAATAVNDAGL